MTETHSDIERITPSGEANPAPMGSLLVRSRIAFNEANRGTERQWYFSPASVTLYRAILRMLDEHLEGKTLDVGAGQLPLRPLVEERGAQYESVDLERRHPDLTYVDDAQKLSTFDDEIYDTVISSQVLEHVADPFSAMNAMARITKPGGKILLTVPHLSRLHEVPHDYYRYTQFGVRAMAEQAGFEVIEVRCVGGLFTFLGQQFCTAFMCLIGLIPGLRRLAYWVNRLVILCFLAIDRLIGAPRLFPTSVLLVGVRKGRS